METVGLRVGEQREGMGWYSLGAGREGIREAQGGFFLPVSLECGLWGGGAVNESLGPLAKTPMGLT